MLNRCVKIKRVRKAPDADSPAKYEPKLSTIVHTTQKDLIAFIFEEKVKSLGGEVSNNIN